MKGIVCAAILTLSLIGSAAQARFNEEVLVRGEITGIDGKFVILALKRRLVMVPRTALMKRYPASVGEKVIARLPLNGIRVTGSTKGKRRK